jgi:predicted Fe-Mo cluster-binding NifX family protein
MRILSGADISIYKAGDHTVEEAVKLYVDGKLEVISQAGPSHAGINK